MTKLKLFVWEHVLTADGLVCVLAKSEEEAWRLLKRKDSTAYGYLQGKFGIKPVRPKIYDSPNAFLVWGQ